MISVIIAEDHLMVRAGLRALLEKSQDISVLGEASNGQEAVDMTVALKPQVLIMDIMMPRMNGIQAANRLRTSKLPVNVVLISMYADDELVHQAIQCGVKGYVLKTSVGDELLLAVRAAAIGETYFSSPISSMLMERIMETQVEDQNLDPFYSLSPREKEILQLIAEEHTSSEIAKILYISEKTVEKHRTNLMDKLKVRNVAGLVRLALKFGLISQDK
ncbi:MAG TPA: response regulator transcription factor [Longilinea sp.]|nr:response regulator transcription factor [Longilinea sp.]